MAPHTPVPPAVALNLALAVVASSNAPVLLLDSSLTVIAASKSFCRAFQIEPEQVVDRSLAALGGGEWNVPQLTALLNATASGFSEVEGYEMELIRPGRGNRCLVLNATKLDCADDSNVRLILTVSDITDARIAEKLKQDLVKEKEVLLQELHHRVANSLQIIASVLMQSARKVQSEETRGHLFDAHQRVMSVASLQQQLAASQVGDVHLRPYLKTLCESIGGSMIRDHDQLSLEVRSDDGITTADTSVSLGLIVTELVINALKHAFPDDRKGKILVDYKTQTANWTLSVADDGVGMSAQPGSAKAGLGTSIVQALTKQLGASINVADANPGAKVSIVHLHVPVLVSQSASLSAAV
ncbi:MAG: PAS domain-containing protein [Alphaproteobacteria bacterium]|nr:PAS domain-containing protein [Alphaproteobacteria bacterium]